LVRWKYASRENVSFDAALTVSAVRKRSAGHPSWLLRDVTKHKQAERRQQGEREHWWWIAQRIRQSLALGKF